jgi:hypothetical protein
MKLALIALALASSARAAVKTATLELKDYILDKPSAAMEGPVKHGFVTLEGEDSVWVLGQKIEILDRGRPAPQYLCHSRLGLADKDVQVGKVDTIRKEYNMNRVISVSQGATDVEFPPGFAFKANMRNRRLLFGAQLQSPAFAGAPLNLSVRTSIRYMDEKSGREAGLQELRSLRFEFPGMSDEHHDHHWMHDHGGQFSVSPGKRVFTQDFPAGSFGWLPYTTTIHYMRPHLHAYATSVELYDVTDGRRLWKGRARTDPATGALAHVDAYSSAEGLRVFRDHAYRVIAEYDNTTSEPVDAMIFLTAYYKRVSR